MSTEQPRMDLPDLTSSHDATVGKDSLVTDSTIMSPGSVCSDSGDTGFASDSTHQETPSPDSEDKLLADSVTGPESTSDKTGKTDETKDSAEEKEDECVDILGNGLLKKKTLVPGAGIDSRPTTGEMVTLKFQGCLEDGTQVEDGEITFTLNDGDVIVAFELVVSLMEKGEKCELFTSSRYAYGELGRQPDIPQNASITYTLELVGVKPQVDISTLACEERLRMGEQKRERGNYLFSRSDYSGAINSYNKAVKLLDDTDLNAGLDEASRAQLADCWTKCYNNMAACQLKIEALDAAIRSCEKVLSSQANNVKALFRIGKAYGAKGQTEEAMTHLKKAIKLDPESKMLHQEMLTLTRKKNKETESERALYQRMLGVKAEQTPFASKDKQKSSNSLMKWTLCAGAVAAVMVSVGLTWYRNS